MLKTKVNIIPEHFAATISIVAGIMAFLSRLGFDNNGLLIIKSILISLFVIFSPHILKTWLIKRTNDQWYISKAFLLLLCLTVLVLAGRFSLAVNIDISYFFLLLGATVFLATLITYNKEVDVRIKFMIYPLFLLFAVFVTSAYSEGFYYHPLMKEKIITGAWAHREAIWHANIAEMLKTYGVSSTGTDGLVPLYYHTFSHFMYGSISGLLRINSMTFYSIVVPILFIPLFFLNFVWCVKEVRKYFKEKFNFNMVDESDIRYWLAMIVIFSIQHRLGSLATSHGTAQLLTFILIAIVFSAINKYQVRKKSIVTTSDMFLILLILLCYLCISFSKLSFLYLIGVSYGYLFIRFKFYKTLLHSLIILGFGLVAIYMYIYFVVPFQGGVSTINYSTDIGLFSYYKGEVLGYLFYIYPSLVYIIFKIYCLKIRSFSVFIKNIKESNLIDIELLLILMVASFIPPYPWFIQMQMYIAYILLLSHLALFFSELPNEKQYMKT